MNWDTGALILFVIVAVVPVLLRRRLATPGRFALGMGVPLGALGLLVGWTLTRVDAADYCGTIDARYGGMVNVVLYAGFVLGGGFIALPVAVGLHRSAPWKALGGGLAALIVWLGVWFLAVMMIFFAGSCGE